MATKTSTSKSAHFEADLAELNQIVSDLSSTTLPLNDLIKKYERGMVLYKQCKDTLNETKKRLITLSLKEKINTAESETSSVDNDDPFNFRLS